MENFVKSLVKLSSKKTDLIGTLDNVGLEMEEWMAEY